MGCDIYLGKQCPIAFSQTFIFPKCIFPKCIFFQTVFSQTVFFQTILFKCIQLTHLLSFMSSFLVNLQFCDQDQVCVLTFSCLFTMEAITSNLCCPVCTLPFSPISLKTQCLIIEEICFGKAS